MKNCNLKLVREYLIITLALCFYVFGWTAFLIPNQIPGGGTTGISTILNYAFGWHVSYTYFIINVALLLVGTIVMGHGFGIKTVYSIVVSSIYFEFFPLIPWTSDITDPLINAIIGGGCCGVGIALVFTQGGSTGGIDIIALIINKYRDITPGRIYVVSDFLIISSILFLPDKNLQDVVYGYIMTIAFSQTVDQLLTGTKQAVQLLIITSKYQELADKLCFEMSKGVTMINSIGWYKKSDSKILMVVVRKNLMQEVMAAVKEVDPNAFFTVSTVMGVYGEGFERVKAKIKKSIETKKGI